LKFKVLQFRNTDKKIIHSFDAVLKWKRKFYMPASLMLEAFGDFYNNQLVTKNHK